MTRTLSALAAVMLVSGVLTGCHGFAPGANGTGLHSTQKIGLGGFCSNPNCARCRAARMAHHGQAYQQPVHHGHHGMPHPGMGHHGMGHHGMGMPGMGLHGQGPGLATAQPFAGDAGPASGQVAYPYYTTRGPRDFFDANPPSIGPGYAR